MRLPDGREIDEDTIETYDKGINIIFQNGENYYVECDDPEEVAEEIAIRSCRIYSRDYK
jgi:hypothetical protein